MIGRASVCFLACTIALVADDADAQQMTPSALGNVLVANVQAHYASTTSWTASFKQHYLSKAYNQTKDAAGTATSSASPPGTYLTYLPQNGQQTFVPCSTSSAFFFLCGSAAYSSFTFQAVPRAQMNFPNGDVLIATPTLPKPGIVKVLLYVDTATFDVRRAMLIDGQGNRTSYDFR